MNGFAAGRSAELSRRAASDFRETFDMLGPKCEVCRQPATVHETVREAGEVTSRHFCQEHGELRVIEEYYRRSLSEAEWEPIARLYRPTDLGA